MTFQEYYEKILWKAGFGVEKGYVRLLWLYGYTIEQAVHNIETKDES